MAASPLTSIQTVEQAQALVNTTRRSDGGPAIVTSGAEHLLAPMVLAAARPGSSLDAVRGWLGDRHDDTPEVLLRDLGETADTVRTIRCGEARTAYGSYLAAADLLAESRSDDGGTR